MAKAKLKIKRMGTDYIVYDPRDFDNYHTHCCYLGTARHIRDNVMRNKIPKSRNIKTLLSHIRVSRDDDYIKQINLILDNIANK